MSEPTNHIKELRIKSGLSYTEFAYRLGIGRSTLFTLEANPDKVKPVYIMALAALSIELAVDNKDPRFMLPNMRADLNSLISMMYAGKSTPHAPKQLSNSEVNVALTQQEQIFNYPGYPKLMVKPKPNKIPGRENELIAFIGKQLCFFDSSAKNDIPTDGSYVEVMITDVLWKHRHDDIGYDFNRVHALRIRPVTDNFRLVKHTGFMRSTSGFGITASAIDSTGQAFAKITPGRRIINVVENETQAVPGYVWVDRIKSGTDSVFRVEGVAKVEDLSSDILNAIRQREAVADKEE